MGETKRILCVDIGTETNKSKTTKCKVPQQNLKAITLRTSYHPHTKYKDDEVTAHSETLTNMIKKNILRQTDLLAVSTYFGSRNGHDIWTHIQQQKRNIS